MPTFQPNAGAVVAADTQKTIAALDGALLDSMRMCMSFIEATQGSGLPAARSQKVLHSLSTGIASVVEGRSQVVSAIRHLNAIKQGSNIAPMNFGCPEGWEQMALDADQPTPRADRPVAAASIAA